jgi:hypothetical protein
MLVNRGKEQQVASGEILKYKKFEDRLEELEKEQNQVFEEMKRIYEICQRSSPTMKAVMDAEDNLVGIMSQWKKNGNLFFDTTAEIRSKLDSLKNDLVNVQSLRNETVRFVNRRNQERHELAERLERESAEASQYAIRAQLDRLKVSSPVSTLPAPQYSSPSSFAPPVIPQSIQNSNSFSPVNGLPPPSNFSTNYQSVPKPQTYPPPQSQALPPPMTYGPSSTVSPQPSSIPPPANTQFFSIGQYGQLPKPANPSTT